MIIKDRNKENENRKPYRADALLGPDCSMTPDTRRVAAYTDSGMHMPSWTHIHEYTIT